MSRFENGQNDTAFVNVTVLNVNDCDPQFEDGDYEFAVNESTVFTGLVVGQVRVHDHDVSDRVTLHLKPSLQARYTHACFNIEILTCDLISMFFVLSLQGRFW